MVRRVGSPILLLTARARGWRELRGSVEDAVQLFPNQMMSQWKPSECVASRRGTKFLMDLSPWRRWGQLMTNGMITITAWPMAQHEIKKRPSPCFCSPVIAKSSGIRGIRSFGWMAAISRVKRRFLRLHFNQIIFYLDSTQWVRIHLVLKIRILQVIAILHCCSNHKPSGWNELAGRVVRIDWTCSSICVSRRSICRISRCHFEPMANRFGISCRNAAIPLASKASVFLEHVWLMEARLRGKKRNLYTMENLARNCH